MGSGRLRGFLDEGASSAGLAVVGGASEIRLRVEPGQAQKVVRFEDDSAVELKAGSLESIESNSSRLTLRLSHGRARFSVTPGGQRTWTVKTEFADVEVVGTVFQVAVEGAALEVLVERGVVVVRSSLIEGGRRQLTAGESLRVSGKPAEDSAPSAEREERRLERAKDEGALSLEQLEEELEDPTVLASSKQEQGGSAAELMGQADVARASGRYAEAERILARLIASFPGDARAASAAFTRGVIQQQALQQPDAAIASFRQVLRLGASTSLREDAYRRWFEVLVGLGRAAEARSVRQQYAQAFPNGQYLPNMGKDSAKGVTTEAGSAP
jgi:hypothetical protein